MNTFPALVFLCLKLELAWNLSCDEIKATDSVTKFSTQDLQTLTDKEFIDCFSLLGRDQLTIEQAEILWKLVLQIHESADQIPEEDLRMLGWIIRGIPADQFLNVSFTDIDTIAAFGRFYDLSFNQLSSLRDAVMDQWNSKDIPDFSSYDLANLGQILCAFNSSDVARIRPDAFRDAASQLSRIKNCSSEVLKGFAKLATDPFCFGQPDKWSALQVSSVGCIIAGLPTISNIPSEAFKGMSPDIVDCLPHSVFQAMSEAQLRALPASSALAITHIALSGDQEDAVQEAIYGPTTRNSLAHKQLTSGIVIILIVSRLLLSYKSC